MQSERKSVAKIKDSLITTSPIVTTLTILSFLHPADSSRFLRTNSSYANESNKLKSTAVYPKMDIATLDAGIKRQASLKNGNTVDFLVKELLNRLNKIVVPSDENIQTLKNVLVYLNENAIVKPLSTILESVSSTYISRCLMLGYLYRIYPNVRNNKNNRQARLALAKQLIDKRSEITYEHIKNAICEGDVELVNLYKLKMNNFDSNSLINTLNNAFDKLFPSVIYQYSDDEMACERLLNSGVNCISCHAFDYLLKKEKFSIILKLLENGMNLFEVDKDRVWRDSSICVLFDLPEKRIQEKYADNKQFKAIIQKAKNQVRIVIDPLRLTILPLIDDYPLSIKNANPDVLKKAFWLSECGRKEYPKSLKSAVENITMALNDDKNDLTETLKMIRMYKSLITNLTSFLQLLSLFEFNRDKLLQFGIEYSEYCDLGYFHVSSQVKKYLSAIFNQAMLSEDIKEVNQSLRFP